MMVLAGNPGLVVLLVGSLFLVLVAVLWCCYRLYPYPGLAKLGAGSEERAAALLRDLLAEAERQQLAQAGYLAVASPSTANRVYRVPAQPGRIDVYDSGRLVMRLCVQATMPLPAGDVVLMHKLLIEGSEREYLSQANVMSRDNTPLPRRRPPQPLEPAGP